MLKLRRYEAVAGDYIWYDNDDAHSCKKSIRIFRKGNKWYLFYSDFVTDFVKMYVLDSFKEAIEYANMLV